MTGHLQPNTVQTARGFLASLDLQPSTYASGQEVIAALVTSVRQRQEDAATRRAFAALVAALADDTFATPERLAHVDCELHDPEALARQLSCLLDGRPPRDTCGRPRLSAGVLAAATLLLGATVSAGCSAGYEPDDARCASDLSLDNFAAMVWNSDLRSTLVDDVEDEYAKMPRDEQEDVIEDLCGMGPDEIADYILENFSSVADEGNGDDWEDSDDWDDYSDDDCGYKGVTF